MVSSAVHSQHVAAMGEGNTPLVRSTRLSDGLGAPNLYFKLESCNPSGSYKDRFVGAEIRHLLERGCRACVATSSGNTGSALAAWCARYGLRCLIVVNQNAPAGKLCQMQAHGAIVLRVPGFVSSPEITERAFAELGRFSEATKTPLVVSAYRHSPVGMAAVQQISTELASALPDLDHVFVPVGGGGLYSAVARGFAGSAKAPLVHAVQPEGCATVLRAFRSGAETVEPVTSTTAISGLSVPFDIDAALALGLLRKNGGQAIGVTDEEVFEAQRLLVRNEGVYAEPAGAAALAGYLRALKGKLIDPASTVVCLVTGHGFKDPSSAERLANETEAQTVHPDRLGATLVSILEQHEIHSN